jgi:hypothetical protein
MRLHEGVLYGTRQIEEAMGSLGVVDSFCVFVEVLKTRLKRGT